MTMTAPAADAAIRAAVAALQRNDLQEARRLCEEVIDAGSPLPPPWFLLAQTCRQLGEERREATALDAVLAAQPRHLGALIMRGDGHARAGDDRAALAFYKLASQTAAAATTPLPPMLAAAVGHAKAAIAELENKFAVHLEDRLGGEAGSDRFRHSLDIMLGRREVYLQQPSSFYFAELPHIQFFERAAFPWLAEVEAAVPAMRAELARLLDEESLLEEDSGFQPYIQEDPNRPRTLHAMRGDPSWSAFHFFEGGELIPANAARCPQTVAALTHAPQPRIRGRSPMALFSLLRPGARIAPHNGLLNTRLICHIPLIVPPGCALRVGNETRAWEEGKALIFDDSIEHEAWNESGETRVVLLFEIWRPEITADERRALTSMYEAITDYGHAPGR